MQSTEVAAASHRTSWLGYMLSNAAASHRTNWNGDMLSNAAAATSAQHSIIVLQLTDVAADSYRTS